MAHAAAHARVQHLLRAARKLKDPADALGKAGRAELRDATGLSREGVDLALELCLEVDPSEAEMQRLLSSVVPSPKSHVLLSANVFLAAHRAIALALAASPEVLVRASRREPSMARLLLNSAPNAFQLVERLDPEPGDQLFAYGTETTLANVLAGLPDGVRFHGHGPGFGLVVVQESAAPTPGACKDLARRFVPDLVLFDQRGCLSPRLVLFEGSAEAAFALAQAIATELCVWELQVPLGRLFPDEHSEIVRFRDTFLFAGSALSAGSGWVCVAPHGACEMLAPIGRNLAIVPVADAVLRAARLAGDVTTFAVQGTRGFAEALKSVLPHARAADIGTLQRPPFDGPVDLRPSAKARIRAAADGELRSTREPPR